GGITILTQERTITATTSADANTQSRTAPDFSPFIESIALVATYTPAGGGVASNRARTEINSVSDPNAILGSGVFEGEGGINSDDEQEFGESTVYMFFTFTVTEATPFRLIASARASTLPTDEFEIQIANLSGGEDVFHLPNSAAPQDVDLNGIIQPGTYSLLYQQEYTTLTPGEFASYTFQFLVPSPGVASVMGMLGGTALLRRRRAH
ncbi:MAG TPA: hypothetical protein VK157_05680, partial [Phycisphaerales bacterium]|nr:hypothetical protein [Phycisphaerales bacterium]